MRRFKKKSTAIIVGVLVVLVGAGAAFAYWTAGGAGTGSAATGAGTDPIVANQTSVVNNMRPGDAAQPLSGNFTNDNDEPVYVTSVTASIGDITVDGDPAAGCRADDYTLANPIMLVGDEVAVGAAVGAWTGATVKFNNEAAENQNGCQGAVVEINYAIA